MGKNFVSRIPFTIPKLDPAQSSPVRVDVIVQKRGEGTCSWRPNNPTTSRLIIGNDNPADLGWLVFN